jgi:hypothetical protein
MSNEIFFQAHIDGGDQYLPVSEIISCFSPYVSEKDKDSFLVTFSDKDSCRIYLDATKETVSHFMVSRPCGDPRLDECLFKVARLGNFVSFEPGFECAFIFDKAAVDHLPEDMRKSISEFRFIRSVEEYRKRYES